MKSFVFRVCAVVFLFSGSHLLFAQSDTIPPVSASVSVDLVSHYIWRGQDYGPKPSIQPGLSATWKDFTLGFWGAYRLAGSGDHETDFYLEKTVGPATFSIWDYWSYSNGSENNYFDYNKNTTSHLFEAQVLLSGGEKLPFNVLGSYFFLRSRFDKKYVSRTPISAFFWINRYPGFCLSSGEGRILCPKGSLCKCRMHGFKIV